MAGPLDAELARAVAGLGLILRGGFRPGPDDGVPDVGDRAAAMLVLVGNAGPAMWRQFSAARARYRGPDPLDDWSRDVIGGIAARFGALALFPFGGAPHHPFQRWALKAESVHTSPLGMLIHGDYGLWHAYRGALAFSRTLDLHRDSERPSPCESCRDRPCLTACPVSAFAAGGETGSPAYDVDACVGHVQAPRGAECAGLGCQARHACPIGRDYRHEPAQAAFHMAAFVRARTSRPLVTAR